MKSAALYSPLRLQPQSSRRLALYLLSIHALAALSLLAVPMPLWLKPGLLLLLAGSLDWSYRMQVKRSAQASIVDALWDGEGHWELTLRSGERIQAELLPDSFITLSLVVLNFSTSRWRRRSLVLTTDNTDPDLLRKLRVRLRLEYREGKPTNPGQGL